MKDYRSEDARGMGGMNGVNVCTGGRKLGVYRMLA